MHTTLNHVYNSKIKKKIPNELWVLDHIATKYFTIVMNLIKLDFNLSWLKHGLCKSKMDRNGTLPLMFSTEP
jgi:hypothetical protein